MSTPRKYSPEVRQQAVEVYEDWRAEPGDRTTADLAKGLGMTRATLYNILKQEGVELTKTVRRTGGSLAPDLVDSMAQNALTVILEQLYDKQRRITELEAELAALRSASAPGTQTRRR